MTIQLSVSDSLPTIVAALLREDKEASDAISEAYDNLTKPEWNAETRIQLRADIDNLKRERSITEARLIGWWRATLIENGFEWEKMTGTNGVER